MSSDAPKRWLVRYRKPGGKWKRSPRFVTRFTGFRSKPAAISALGKLRVQGYVGHVAAYDHLRVVALSNARSLIGIMEHGGNNQGEAVMQIIRENGGTSPEPWCGNFCAKVYRDAGSNSVTRAWAAVRLLGGLAGLKVVGKRKGAAGDLIRFTFDHVGILEGYCDAQGNVRSASSASHVRTIEGNTGATGAVSDSSTGGDGVYRKVRPLTQVQDCVVVLR